MTRSKTFLPAIGAALLALGMVAACSPAPAGTSTPEAMKSDAMKPDGMAASPKAPAMAPAMSPDAMAASPMAPAMAPAMSPSPMSPAPMSPAMSPDAMKSQAPHN